jgi:hypothetical protein
VNRAVTVRTITGTWVDADPDFEMEVVQSGPTFTGKLWVQGKHMSNIRDGVLSDPRNVRFFRQWTGKCCYGVYQGRYEGTLDASLDKINVTSGAAASFGFTRR